MRLNYLELNGFKSFPKKTILEFNKNIVCIVGPNGSGKSNIVEAFRFALGEQSMKTLRGKGGTDLIFKGSKNLSKSTKASVSVFFNNQDRIFKFSNEKGEEINLNYDNISISREVYIDGLNKYILNDSEVRLKDINNLLASVNIGSSSHHIISQGEADRILNASPKERKEMIEDALGLKVYQYKVRDSERKLERASNNMKEVSLLRRENAPHIKFLKNQVEKFEKMKELRVELLAFYREYFKKESVYLGKEKNSLSIEKNKISKELSDISSIISDKYQNNNQEENKKLEELTLFETQISNIRRIKSEIERKLGRIEGMIEIEENRKEEKVEIVVISEDDMNKIINEINYSIDEALKEEDSQKIKDILKNIKNILNQFNQKQDNNKINDISIQIENLKKTEEEILFEMKKVEIEENNLTEKIKILKIEINKEIEERQEEEREKFSLRVKQQELSSALELNTVKEENLNKQIENLEEEKREGIALIGDVVLSYRDFEITDDIDRNTQEELKKKIERIKIKLEDSSFGNGTDILREFKEVTERDEFLVKEMEDLSLSIESLNKLILDLKEKIDIEFKEGVKKINIEFQNFFSLMFGGGNSSLSIVVENKSLKKRLSNEEEKDEQNFENGEDEIIFEQGIEINVSLPHKKVKELHSLSGGERSLTSIALLFAMSQVNPPPFLILDETDAALDEANSRKYGDMLEKLAEHSQLIVVTHNRETMSRANILYGVTIDRDGASKLLSVKFDEAVAIAK